MEAIPDPAQPRSSWGKPRELRASLARGGRAVLGLSAPRSAARAWPNLLGLLGLFLLSMGLLGLLLRALTSGLP